MSSSESESDKMERFHWETVKSGDGEEEKEGLFRLPFRCRKREIFNIECTDCFIDWVKGAESSGGPWVGTLMMFACFDYWDIVFNTVKVKLVKRMRKLLFIGWSITRLKACLDLSEESANLIESLAEKINNPDLETLKIFVDKHRADLKRRDCKGKSVLHYAAKKGKREMVEYIIEETRGEIINGKDYEGQSPLHLAAEGGHFDVVKHLLENGAETNIKDNQDQTPLHIACELVRVTTEQDGKKRLDLRIIKELLKREPEVIKERSRFGKTPFHRFFECQQRSYTEKEISGSLCFWSINLILEEIGLIEKAVSYNAYFCTLKLQCSFEGKR